MEMIVGLPTQQDNARPIAAVHGISDRARLESERRMVGTKPQPPVLAPQRGIERRDAA